MWHKDFTQALAEHSQNMATYQREHPIRAAFGASYQSDAKQVTENLDSSVHQREREAQQCTREVERLQHDPHMLQRAERDAVQRNENIDQAQRDISKLEQALAERTPRHEQDAQIRAQEQELSYGRQLERDRGREMGMVF